MMTHTKPTQIPNPGRYRIDPQRSTLRFRTRHLFGLGVVHGRIAMREAELVVGSPPTETTLHAVFDAASFDTGLRVRDSVIRSPAYLGTYAFPDITFTSHSAHLVQQVWEAAGVLMVRGTPAPVVVRLEHCAEVGDEVMLRASAKVDRYAHGVTATRGLAGRWLTVQVDVVARAANRYEETVNDGERALVTTDALEAREHRSS